MARWRYRRSSHVARRLTLEAEQQKYSEIAALMSVTVGLSQFRNAMQSFHTAWNHSENQNQTGLGGKADIQRERHCDRLMLRRTAGRAIQLHTSQQWCCAPAPSPVGVNSVVALLLDLRFRPKAAYTRLVLRDLGLMHGTPCFDQATHTQPINSLRTMASMTSMPAWLSFRAGR